MVEISNEAVVRMTSRETAELVGSPHDKVKQSIERLVARGVILNPPMGVFEEINNLGLPIEREVYVFEGELTQLYRDGSNLSHEEIQRLRSPPSSRCR